MKTKMKSRFFGITSLLIASILIINSLPSTALAANQEPLKEISLTETDLIAASQPLIESQSKFYNIANKQVSNIKTIAQKDGTTETTFDLTLSMVLKAKSVSDLPFIKGMLQKVGADTVDECTEPAIAEKIAQDQSITAGMSIAAAQGEKVNIAQIMADVIATANNTYKEYIGSTSDFCYNIKVTTGSDGKVLSVGALTFENYVPLEVFFPQSESEMMESGADTFNTNVLNALAKASSQTVSPNSIIYPAYKRLSARDYANTWTSEQTSEPYIDETYYNPTYSSYNNSGGDCANYVSQAMYEGGGVAMDSYWQYYTSSWISCTDMRYYFTIRTGYWNTSNNASCNAGGIIMLCDEYSDPYHVEMCVMNDTINKKLSGHNRDRKEHPYSNDYSLTGDYNDVVEYYVFNNVVDE